MDSDEITEWGEFVETTEYKEEVKNIAEDSMGEVERALESAMDEVGNIIMTELEQNHPELGDPYDEGVRDSVENIAAEVLSEWLKSHRFVF